MEPIEQFLQGLKLAPKQEHKNLALYPLLASPKSDPDYLVLSEALDLGLVTVTEVDESGHVPELKLVNRAPQPVLIIEGEELVGAKQNRIVNVTILVAANSELGIPVSCVEQGRWSYRNKNFSSVKRMMVPSMRREHSEQTNVRLRMGRRDYASNQGEIWGELETKFKRMNASSETGAMSDLFEKFEDPIIKYMDAFRVIDCQVGAVFFLNGRLAGLDYFGHEQTLGGYFDALVKSYALDALDRQEIGKISRPATSAAQDFIDRVARCEVSVYEAPGLGESVRLEGNRIIGSALVEGRRLLHLSAFYYASEGSRSNHTRLLRYSKRRSRNYH